jgi:hypothetical protein
MILLRPRESGTWRADRRGGKAALGDLWYRRAAARKERLMSDGKRLRRVLATAFVAFGFLLLVPSPSRAIPAFARKYNVTCYSCHTVFPRLNKTGYLFKKLGYRMPPDLEEGKPVPKISEIDKDVKWNLNTTAALVVQTSVTVDTAEEADGSSTTSNSFNLDHALLFLGSPVPDSQFSYFSEFKLFEDQESALETAMIEMTGGTATSSYFAKAGKMHLQETEGFRGSDPLGLFDEGPLMFSAVDVNNFTLDQAPVGVELGYTWASMYYKQVLGLALKVTNGLDADGGEIALESDKKAKDLWFEGDFLFGPDGGVSVMGYLGKKFQVQNAGTADEFTYEPQIQRFGVFANYLFIDKLDVIGGYMHGKDDYQALSTDPISDYNSDDFYGEVEYYISQGFVAMGRYEKLKESIDTIPGSLSTEDWALGIQKTLTKEGNVRARLSYAAQRITDPEDAVTKDKLLKLDIRLGW